MSASFQVFRSLVLELVSGGYEILVQPCRINAQGVRVFEFEDCVILISPWSSCHNVWRVSRKVFGSVKGKFTIRQTEDSLLISAGLYLSLPVLYFLPIQ